MAVKTSQNMRSGVAALGYIVKSTAGQDPSCIFCDMVKAGDEISILRQGRLVGRIDGAALRSRLRRRWSVIGSWGRNRDLRFLRHTWNEAKSDE